MVLFPEISGVHGDLADSDGPTGCLLDLTSRDCWDPGRGHRAMPNIILLTHIPFHLPRFNVECSLWKHASWAFRNVPASLMHYTAVSRDCLWRSCMPDGRDISSRKLEETSQVKSFGKISAIVTTRQNSWHLALGHDQDHCKGAARLPTGTFQQPSCT